MNKEDAVKIKLSMWLEEHGFRVWWEKHVQGLPFETFSIRGTRAKPDLLIQDKDTGLFAAIEVKISDRDRNTIDGSKITKYYKDYINGTSR